MMQCLATVSARARAGSYEGGGRCGEGGGEARGRGRAPTRGTQRPQRLLTVAAPRLLFEVSLELAFLIQFSSSHLALAPVSPPS